MRIQYIPNTYHVDNISFNGDVFVLVQDGEPLSHIDLTHSNIGVTEILELLTPFGVDPDLGCIDNPSTNLITKINQYMAAKGYANNKIAL